MREMFSHGPGWVFLLVLFLSTVAVIGVVAAGVLEETVILFGWMTLPLLLGVAYIIIWLIAYLVYFFRYWPYR